MARSFTAQHCPPDNIADHIQHHSADNYGYQDVVKELNIKHERCGLWIWRVMA